MNKKAHVFLYLLVALASGIGGYLVFQAHDNPVPGASSVTRSRSGSALVGTIRPDFSLPDLEARQRGPEEWNGKILILNFWASWCPPCLQEIPAFIRLQEKYAGQDVQFVGIALQQPEDVRDFVIAKGINYPVLAGETEVIKVAEEYGNLAGTLPYTVIIDRRQHIAFIKRGPLAEAEADRIINSLVGKKENRIKSQVILKDSKSG